MSSPRLVARSYGRANHLHSGGGRTPQCSAWIQEASYALGANRLQTIVRVLVPASLSGIISAILLGLGRVIGETMVVLLCAGNRIAIPDFYPGTGRILPAGAHHDGNHRPGNGEVVRGSIHYRALFMVGLVLFVLTLGSTTSRRSW